MIVEFKGIKPKIGSNVFIAPTATVIGNVEIHDNANIWFGTVIKGDRAPIVMAATRISRTNESNPQG